MDDLERLTNDPDPSSWSALADYHEEAGRPDEAERCRLAKGWHEAVLARVREHPCMPMTPTLLRRLPWHKRTRCVAWYAHDPFSVRWDICVTATVKGFGLFLRRHPLIDAKGQAVLKSSTAMLRHGEADRNEAIVKKFVDASVSFMLKVGPAPSHPINWELPA